MIYTVQAVNKLFGHQLCYLPLHQTIPCVYVKGVASRPDLMTGTRS